MATAIAAYDDPALNQLYNLLFADDVAAFAAATPAADPAGVASDGDAESRLRAVAFRKLKAGGLPPSSHPPLLGVVVEIALPAGLDTLAAYADGRIRYINHGGGVTMVEEGSPLQAQVDGLLLAAGPVIARIGPWHGDRLPPPSAGHARLTFLVGGELYFGEGRFEDLSADPLAGPVLRTATALLTVLVDFQRGGSTPGG